jgi:hypothetical protein
MIKSGCEFEQLFEGYFRSDLSPAEELALLNHLQTCERCRVQLENFYTVHTALLKYQRPSAPSDLKNSYYQQVDLSFGKESFSEKFSLFLNKLFGRRSTFARAMQFVVFIIIGIVVGWILFFPSEPNIVYQHSDPYQTSQPVSSDDLKLVYAYLQMSEILLLQIQNDPEFYLNRELAQKLLIKTFRVSDITVKLGNLRMIQFLNRMEILLLEASNIDEEELNESIALIRKVVEDSNLLSEVENLKSYFALKKEQFGT